MADLEFISTISSTFVDEINKFIKTFTSTIKTQFEDVESKLKAQELEITKLREELNSKKYEEKNYTSVSVIKNQDKQIYELNNTIKTLENRLKFLEQKTHIGKETNPIKSIIENKNPIDIDIVAENTDTTETNNTTENTAILEEKLLEAYKETSPEPIAEPIIVKKIVKKISKKTSVEPVIEPNSEITTENTETIIEKPKRKIAMKKSVKNEVPTINSDIAIDSTSESVKIESNTETNTETNTDTPEPECIVKENTIKTKKTDVKKDKEKEKETKPATSIKKDKEPKKPIEVKEEVKEEAISTIEVKYPDTIPHLDSVNILELDNIDYYLDDLTDNVFQITPSEEIGAFIGKYDKDSKKIIKMSE